MRYLTVLYDRDCHICRRARVWLDSQPKYVPLRYVAAQSDEARAMFPTLADTLLDKFTVVSDEGAVYREEAAWLMCLYALKRYRHWSRKLAAPGRRYLVKLMVQRISRNRLSLSKWLGTMLDTPPVPGDAGDDKPLFCAIDGTCEPPDRPRIEAFTRKYATPSDARPRARGSELLPGEWFD